MYMKISYIFTPSIIPNKLLIKSVSPRQNQMQLLGTCISNELASLDPSMDFYSNLVLDDLGTPNL